VWFASINEVIRLSKHKFEEEDEDIKLTEELVGSLRSLKPEGNLLKDRFKSFQVMDSRQLRLIKVVILGSQRHRDEGEAQNGEKREVAETRAEAQL